LYEHRRDHRRWGLCAEARGPKKELFEKTWTLPDVKLAAWQAAGKAFRHRGFDIFYRDEGSGHVLLLIHGFPTASYDWHRVWPELLSGRRLIAPDMIGFGFSAKPRDYAYSILDQADIHEALLASLEVTECDVVAHDYGDTVAQELLARFNERAVSGKPGLRIRSMTLLNGGLFPEVHRARFIQKLLMTPLGPLLSRLSNARSFGQSFAPIFGPKTQPTPDELADYWRIVSYNDGQRISHKLIRYIEERRRYRERWVGALQKTSVPLRLINGPEDPVSGAHMAERYRGLVPNPDVVVLPGIGHYPQVEDPAGVVKGVREFLAGRGAQQAGQLSGMD
jgi:pimeloyl-ACP methyl ester carboxylesterase